MTTVTTAIKEKAVAILVPTKDRSKWVGRMLSYLAFHGCSSPIYVGDCSSDHQHSEELGAVLMRTSSQLTMKIVDCRDLPAVHSLKDPLMRLLTICSEPYVLYVEDDHLVEPSGVLQCAQFLECYPGLRTVHGQALCFHLPADEIQGSVEWIREYQMPERPELDIRERLLRYYECMYLPYLSVHRREEFIQDLAPCMNFEDANFFELLLNSLSIIRGPSRQVPNFLFARPAPRPPIYNIPPGSAWIASDAFDAGRRTYFEAMKLSLCEHGLSAEDAWGLTLECFDRYLQLRFPSRPPRYPLQDSYAPDLVRPREEIRSFLSSGAGGQR